MIKEATSSRPVFVILLVLTAIFSFFVIKPFLSAILIGVILAYIFNPIYEFSLEKTNNRNTAAFATILIIILVVAIPSIFIFNGLTSEAQYIYTTAKQHISTGRIIGGQCHYEDGIICDMVNSVNKFIKNPETKTYANNMLNGLITFVTTKAKDVILGIPGLIINIVITFFVTFATLVYGRRFFQKITKLLPLTVHHQEHIFKQFSDVIHAIIFGSIIVAIIQGVLATIGYWIVGFEGFIFLGILTTLGALVPVVGTATIWFPASTYLMLTGYLDNETTLIAKGIGLFIYGLLIVGMIDNFLKPIIVAGRAKVPSVLILVGVLGGLASFGIVGAILGPLALALLQKLVIIYEQEFKHHKVKTLDILGLNNHHKK